MMTIIKRLLAVVLLFAVSHSVPLQDDDTAANTEATEESRENPYRLPKQVVPLHYDVKLIPHIVEGNFTTNGETIIDVEVREPTNTIALHTMNITLDELWTKLTRKSEEENTDLARTHVPKEHHYNEETLILNIRFEDLLDPGIYSLHLKFAGILADNARGFYKTFYTDDHGNKVWLAMTHFQPVTARQAFPCWDEPAIKATFTFSIKHYPNYTALSNMPSTRVEVDETDGKVWTHFEATPVMSTNILGFVVADYDHVSNLDGTIRIWAPKQLLQYAPSRLEIAEKATRELEMYTNSTVHVPKMDHVTAPEYTSSATENWGMIVYKDNVLLGNENERKFFHNIYGVMTITHELAHQWFGNLVSPAWWQYLWLSEGISTYLKFLITEKFIKEWQIMDLFVVNLVYHLFIMDSYKSRSININVTNHMDVYAAYGFTTYRKSAAVLHMLANVLTQDVFRNGLIKYLQAHEYGTVTPDDLWKALQDAVDESDVPHDDFNVKEIMKPWIEQGGYPIVTIKRDYITGNIGITQKKFQYLNSDNTDNNRTTDETWWIPINFATRSNLDFSSTLPTHWLKPQDESLTIEGVDVDDWIIVNKQLTGYYRVNYDTTNWKRIAGFLNSDNYGKIARLNRAQIINDASFLVSSNQLDIITYLEIVNYLQREVDPIVWILAFDIMDELENLPRISVFFKRYIFRLIQKLHENIGLDDRPEDNLLTIYVRACLLNYACTYGDPECRAEATAKLHAYLEDPVANEIPYNSRFLIVCFALMTANESDWNQLRQVFNKTDDEFAGCSTNFDILEKQLHSKINNYTYNQFYDLFVNMLKEPSNVDGAIDLFINNFDRISEVMRKDSITILYHIVAQSCTKEQLQKIKIFAERFNINLQLDRYEEKIAKVESILSEIRSAFENNQFTIAMDFDNDILNTI